MDENRLDLSNKMLQCRHIQYESSIVHVHLEKCSISAENRGKITEKYGITRKALVLTVVSELNDYSKSFAVAYDL